MATVSFEHVSKQFGDVDALADFCLDVADGEFIVLVGPSGSGKTTALRILAGLEALSSGIVRIGGRGVNDLPPRARDIAMVFQNYALYPHMTVYQNLAYGLRMRKLPKHDIDARVREAAEMLGLGPLLNRKPGQMSGGQRQRVALGRALVREPQVFLMDEPLSNLDAKLRVQTRGEIWRLQRRVGTTTVYVTHDQVEAMTMGDRIVVMSDGRIEQIGDPDTVYDDPANMFVAGFIGSPPMAFGPFGAVREGDQLTLRNGPAVLQVPARPGVGPEVSVGVRPEHARMWTEGSGLLGPLEGAAEFVESLGRETFVGVNVTDGVRFIVQVEGKSHVRIGERVQFGLVRNRLYLFDTKTSQAIK
jgi:multiple sugar transport system ATP-binding protein